MTPKTREQLEAKLKKDLRHTLKLVPSSQRDLFVSELAMKLSDKELNHYITTLQRQHERELVGKVIKPHSTIPVETFGKKDYVSLDWIVAQLTTNQEGEK